ncbi:MAG: hypothetical protein LUC50_06730 [Ruminococcus sp.]|nr:hypothetical protein [Ruminococcus sp.]
MVNKFLSQEQICTLGKSHVFPAKPDLAQYFFAGCALDCVFYQNHEISRRAVGKPLTVRQHTDTFLLLQEKQACNLNIVTGSHYTPWIIEALELTKPLLKIPVVWNCSGY